MTLENANNAHPMSANAKEWDFLVFARFVILRGILSDWRAFLTARTRFVWSFPHREQNWCRVFQLFEDFNVFTDELPHEKHFFTNMILRLRIKSLVLLHVLMILAVHSLYTDFSTFLWITVFGVSVVGFQIIRQSHAVIVDFTLWWELHVFKSCALSV